MENPINRIESTANGVIQIVSTQQQAAKHTHKNSFELLCMICSRTVSRQSVSALTANDWRQLWLLSLRHKVSPIFSSAIAELGVDVPLSISTEMTNFNRHNLMKAMRHSAELARLTELFNNSEVRFLAFKGLALTGLMQQSLNQRHCGDIDLLLIDPDKLPEANELLISLGYQPEVELDYEMLRDQKTREFFNHKDLPYSHSGSGVRLELHFSLFHIKLLPLLTEDVYENRSDVTIGSVSVPVMSMQDHMLYLLLHCSISSWNPLKWIYDIPLISNNGTDYMSEEFEARAYSLGVHTCVDHGLAMAHRVLGMPVKGHVKSFSESSKVERIRQAIAMNRLTSDEGVSEYKAVQKVKSMFVANCIYFPSMRKELSFKLGCVSSLFRSVRDYELLPLPSYLYWLYYPLRPLLWLLRQFKGAR